MKMRQKEFEELSKKEVKELNRGDKSAEEAWRAGYIYLQQQILGWRESMYHHEYMGNLDEICDQELDYFEDWQ